MKTTITKPLYALLLLLTVCLGLHAQKIEEFTFSHIGQADGMHSQRIYSVVQTSDGALWWSSKHGVELAYKWTKDMLTVFKENNIAWTTWCYDADFGFWDQQKHDYKDKGLVDLLTEK